MGAAVEGKDGLEQRGGGGGGHHARREGVRHVLAQIAHLRWRDREKMSVRGG